MCTLVLEGWAWAEERLPRLNDTVDGLKMAQYQNPTRTTRKH
jgi:hypothetical protein